jgi:thiosulfate dehydrogenase
MSRIPAQIVGLVALAAIVMSGCKENRGREPNGIAQSGSTTAGAGWDASAWRAPTAAEVPKDSLGAAIRRGLALVVATADSLPQFVGSNLNCTSCHLDEGRRATAAPLTGVFARYPKYIDRTGAVVSMEERVNYCMTRSLAGSRLPNDSREMQDILAYLAFMARGVPIGEHLPAEGMPIMPKLHGDTVRGDSVYRTACARCHGVDGRGLAKVPALWGRKSFSIGASMARQERAASFIRHNMPFDQPGTLSDRDAFDVAAFITAQPRPDLPRKANDWPFGKAPVDVPYNTRGHKAYLPPPLIPRANPSRAVVPMPPSARVTAGER